MTKMEMAMQYMREHGSITSMEAIMEHGNTRLSGSICKLRKRGEQIITIPKDVTDRFGNRCRIAEYRLIERA